MSKFKKIMLILLFTLLFVLIFAFVKIQDTKIIYEKRVTDYLLDEQGYEKKEIESVEGKWGVKLPSFYTIVVFEDEPFVKYIYFAHNGVLQFDYILTEEAKKSGIGESELKHYVPFE